MPALALLALLVLLALVVSLPYYLITG